MTDYKQYLTPANLLLASWVLQALDIELEQKYKAGNEDLEKLIPGGEEAIADFATSMCKNIPTHFYVANAYGYRMTYSMFLGMLQVADMEEIAGDLAKQRLTEADE